MSTEQILYSSLAAVALALSCVVVAIWKFVVKPTMDDDRELKREMIALVQTLKVEQPKQTKNLESQTASLKVIEANSKASKAATAEHLKLQNAEMQLLADIKAAAEAGKCRYQAS